MSYRTIAGWQMVIGIVLIAVVNIAVMRSDHADVIDLLVVALGMFMAAVGFEKLSR